MRVLIAGVGNVLRGDDGFGVEVLRRLMLELGEMVGLCFFESGQAGISLVQQLLDKCDAMIVLDALDRDLSPGTVLVLEPGIPPDSTTQLVDLHRTGPEGILRLATALGVLPRHVWIVGCQAANCEDLGSGLSEPVRRAVAVAVQELRKLLARLELGEVHGSL